MLYFKGNHKNAMQIKERLPSRGEVREQRNKTNFMFNGKMERMISLKYGNGIRNKKCKEQIQFIHIYDKL